MQRSNYQTLLNRGRKAGLNARELNQALGSRPLSDEDQALGQPDCNGSVWSLDEHGHRVMTPPAQA